MFMKIKEKLLKIKDRIKEFCNFLKRKFCDIKNMIKAFLKKMFCYMRNRMKKIWKFLKTNISNVILFIIIVSCFVFGCYHGKFTLEELNKEYVSYFEIIIEAIFLFFVLKEFKMTKKSFEWQKKEQEEKMDKEIKEKIRYFAWICIDEFVKYYKNLINKLNMEEISQILLPNQKSIDNICTEITKKYKLPFEFCNTLILNSIKQLTTQFMAQQRNSLDIYEIYDYFVGWKNRIFTTDVFTPSYINRLKEYFKSDKEINEIYEQLTK